MLAGFLVLPFVFSAFLALFFILKNPIYIRRIAKSFYSIQLIYSFIILFLTNENGFSFLNLNLELNEASTYILFLANFIFFLFSIISKKFILKLNRAFYAISFLLLGLINLTIFSNNIFTILIAIFWTFLIGYFLNVSYCKEEAKKGLMIQLTNDIFWLFGAFCLILYDFPRYFILNDIEFSFISTRTGDFLEKLLSCLYIFLGICFVSSLPSIFSLISWFQRRLQT